MAGESGQEVGAALGTIAYTAHEVFDDGATTKASDVYAFGILCERCCFHLASNHSSYPQSIYLYKLSSISISIYLYQQPL